MPIGTVRGWAWRHPSSWQSSRESNPLSHIHMSQLGGNFSAGSIFAPPHLTKENVTCSSGKVCFFSGISRADGGMRAGSGSARWLIAHFCVSQQTIRCGTSSNPPKPDIEVRKPVDISWLHQIGQKNRLYLCFGLLDRVHHTMQKLNFT